MPILTASTPMSSATARTCSTMNSPGTGWIAVTPTVFCAFSAVIAVIPCTPQRANAFRSAWIPAPPPESEPAIDSTAGTGLDIPVRLGPAVGARGAHVLSGSASMAPLRADDVLAGYAVSEGVFDEAFSSSGEPRPHARAGLEAVARADAAELPDRIGRSLQRAGVRFSSVEGDHQFYVDPVPRVIPAADWEPVKRGLAQRVRALNAFVADVYGSQRIVAEGVIPPEVVRSADYFEPGMRGIEPPGGIWIGVAGL